MASFMVFPLMIAVAKGDVDMIKVMLMNQTLDINVIDLESGINSFWLACLYGQGEIMSLLADSGIDIFVSNRNKLNVLHLAIIKNHIEIVQMLSESGFPLDTLNDNGMTPLHLSALLNHIECTQIILNTLKSARFENSIKDDIVSYLSPENTMSPLSLAILMQNQEIGKMLIEAGAKYYYTDSMIRRDISPIFLACEMQNIEIIELMCDNGAKLSEVNSLGETPLMFATKHQKLKIINYLSLRAKNLNIEDLNCQNIFVQLLFSGNFDMANRMLVRGADINYSNENG